MPIHIYSLIFFLTSYINGLLLPVLSLLMIDKEVSLSGLSLMMGMYAVTVVLCELPTGIMADMMGRKKTFCISLMVSLVSAFFFLFGKGIVTIGIGMVLQGLTRAISSGSLDALFIDAYVDSFGKDALYKITTRLSMLDALGLSAGALTGGWFPGVSKNYLPAIGAFDLNIMIKLFLTAVILVLAFIFIQETIGHNKEISISLRQHMRDSSAFIIHSKTTIGIFISVFSTGFFLCGLETYWQPHFISLMGDGGWTTLLGIMAFLYLAAAMAGNMVSGIFIKRVNTQKIYLTLRVCLALSLIVMALQIKVAYFIPFYTLVYLIFGMANIPEGVILNHEVPNKIRASVLSVNSLILQVGGLTGAVVNSLVIHYMSIPVLWMISAGVMTISTGLTFKKLMYHQRNRDKKYPMAAEGTES